MPRRNKSTNKKVASKIRRNTTVRRKSAQKKFNLPKPQKSVVNQLTNILETKKFQGLDYNSSNQWVQNPIEVGYFSNTNAGISFMPDTFYRHQFMTDINTQLPQADKDLSNNCIEGTSIFSKYLQVKIQIDYPDALNAPEQCPRPIEVIWGWVNPLNFTEFTNPKIDEVTPAQIREHTLDAIAAEFNSQTDPMEFHDKVKRRYNIIGRHKMLPQLDKQVPTRLVGTMTGLAGGGSAKIHKNINFPMMKKVNYTQSTAKGDAMPQFAYPNEAYLPFVYLYNPDYSMYGSQPQERPQFKFNDCHWFNDA